METINNGLRTYKLYAEMKKGTSFKFYEVVAQELEEGGRATLVANWGRIGAKGQSKNYGTFRSYFSAKSNGEEQFEKKLKKGYVKASALQALASACQEPEERLEECAYHPREVTFPVWGTGNPATDKRLEKLAEQTLTKLNLVRSDKERFYSFNSGYSKYFKEAARLIEAYGKAYRRMSKTNAHSRFCDEDVERKVRSVFNRFTEDFCHTRRYGNRTPYFPGVDG